MPQVTFKINDENVHPNGPVKRKLKKGTPHPKKKARRRIESDDQGASAVPLQDLAQHSQQSYAIPAISFTDPDEAFFDVFEDSQKTMTVTNTKEMWKANIEAVYREKNPAKFDNIPALMDTYKGNNLPTLYAKICKTYNLDPKKMYAVEGFPTDPIKSQDRLLPASSIAGVAQEWRNKANEFDERVGLDPHDINTKKAFLFRNLAKSFEKHHGVESKDEKTKTVSKDKTDKSRDSAASLFSNVSMPLFAENTGRRGSVPASFFHTGENTLFGTASATMQPQRNSVATVSVISEQRRDAVGIMKKTIEQWDGAKKTDTPQIARRSSAPVGKHIFGTPSVFGLGNTGTGFGARDGFDEFAHEGGFGAKNIFGFTGKKRARALHRVGGPVFEAPSAVGSVAYWVETVHNSTDNSKKKKKRRC